MPRLYRESPLNSIWEGSGNVICLDVLRAIARSPQSLEAFFAEVEQARGAEPRLDALRRRPARPSSPTSTTIETRARRIVERDGARAAGLAAGALRATRPSRTPSAPRASTATGAARSARCPPGIDAAAIIERHRPKLRGC